MRVQVDLDENTMQFTEQENNRSITVTVRLANHDIMDSGIQTRMTQLWTELNPLQEFIEQVVLETTASNVSVVRPLAWLFPIPLTPVQLQSAAK